jgi:hypothetical protein
MVRLFLIALPLALLSGCKTQSDLYCAANPSVCTAGGPDGSNGSNDTSCHSSTDCTSHTDTSVCDTSNGMCVACTTADTHACPGEVCKNDACQPCTKHSDCASHTCLAAGTCAKATEVAYVRPTGSGTACSDAAPCKTLNDALGTTKAIIKVEGAITDTAATVIDGKAVQILADTGSKLSRTMPGTILDVRNDGADVRIYDLEITGGVGDKMTNVVSLSNMPASTAIPKLTLTRVKVHDTPGIGIATTAGTLTLSRCSISNNAGGGLSIMDTDFSVINNFILGNGGASGVMATMFGGVSIVNAGSGTRQFEFNTVANNTADAGMITGVNCAVLQTFSNNIVFDNATNGGRMSIGGTCSWAYSDIEGTLIAGTGNLNTSPSFVMSGTDYHLKSDSPAKNVADPAATLNVDFDGEARPQDGRSDMGADEFKLPP